MRVIGVRRTFHVLHVCHCAPRGGEGFGRTLGQGGNRVGGRGEQGNVEIHMLPMRPRGEFANLFLAWGQQQKRRLRSGRSIWTTYSFSVVPFGVRIVFGPFPEGLQKNLLG